MSRNAVLALVLTGLAGAAWAGHRVVAGRVDRAVAEASATRPELLVEQLPGQVAPLVEQGRARLWADTTSARDGAVLDGRTVVATAGGLVELDSRGRATRTLDVLAGLADHDLTAVATEGETAWLGTRSGLVAVVERGRVRALRLGGGLGAVVDLAFHAGHLYVATTSGTVVRLDGARGRALAPTVAGGVTALASDPEGLLVAGADGAVYREVEGDRLEVAARRASPGRLTALATRGGDLFVGTPTGLLAASRGEETLRPAREHLIVTALLPSGDELLVGTVDDGVLVLDAARPGGSPRRHLLRGRRVDRLRLVGGRPAAFGPGLAAVIDRSGRVDELELPRSLASGQVTALAFDGSRRLWVGHFDDGLDVLGADGRAVRRLPDPPNSPTASVNALAWDANVGVMLVATAHGLLEVGESSERVLGAADGLVGESVTALLVRDGLHAVATSRGVSVLEGGVARSITGFHGLPSNRAYALAATRERLYVGTLGGLAELDGLRVVRVLRAGPEGLAASYCTALAAAPEGVYVGTTSGGVDLVREDGSVRRHPVPGAARVTVNPGALLVAGEHLLVGTLEHGLLVLDRRDGQWEQELRDGLPPCSVTAFAADDEHLYIGTDRGLLRLVRSALGV